MACKLFKAGAVSRLHLGQAHMGVGPVRIAELLSKSQNDTNVGTLIYVLLVMVIGDRYLPTKGPTFIKSCGLFELVFEFHLMLLY